MYNEEKGRNMDKSKFTPMMQHYLTLKEENPDCILMYRLGDFYEMFFEDAVTVSRELDLVLTGRAAGEQKAPMCGVPYHAAESYITRLVKKGYKVAVCEQLSDPATSKGLVERGIVRIVTPGTLLDDADLKADRNYLTAVHSDGWKICLLFCELSTGELRYAIVQRSITEVQKILLDLKVKEVVSDRSLDKTWQNAMKQRDEWVFSTIRPAVLSSEEEQLDSREDPIIKETLKVLMGYLDSIQMREVLHLVKMKSLYPKETMVLDPQTRAHLELIRSASSSGKAQSLWEFMDLCSSSLGSRMLKNWIESPLLDVEKIQKRQEAVQILLDQYMLKDQLKDHLHYVYDLERIAMKIAYRTASPKDVAQLVSTLAHAGPVLELAKAFAGYPELQDTPDCHELYESIKDALVEEPPLTLKDGNVIAPGYSEKLDEVRILADHASQALAQMEERERQRTGIKNLKIGNNRVFGYYIEVRASQKNLIKDEYGYIPKQTLANAMRYITQDLKDLEERIMQAQNEKISLEQQIFSDIVEKIRNEIPQLHALANALALIDVLTAFSELAQKQGYVCPSFSKDGHVEIVEGRHPILEARTQGYVSNSWKMKSDTCIQIVTGPNMGGKSTWLRQNALIVIMAQIGSFVPARKAVLPVFDRIFTRIGASDDLLEGKSTFMVEMTEANTALKYATDKSLILFDEIGRGTATYDGMALAQAMLEFIDSVVQAKTLFSTHYHELTDLSASHPAIENLHAEVREEKGDITFRYRMIKGKADKSYGINVARLAHLPAPVLDRAHVLLEGYENQKKNPMEVPTLFVMDPQEAKRAELVDTLVQADLDSMSARDALNCLYDLQKKAKEIN